MRESLRVRQRGDGSFSVPPPAENQTATMTSAVPWAYINGLADADAQHGVRTGVPWPGPYTIKAACSPATASIRAGFAFVLSGGPPPVRWWRGVFQ
jgi:hypothetical protein